MQRSAGPRKIAEPWIVHEAAECRCSLARPLHDYLVAEVADDQDRLSRSVCKEEGICIYD